MIWARDEAEGCRLELLVQPRASRTRVCGEHGGRLKVQLAAPPINGEANGSLVEFLAKALSVRKSSITIVHGETGRRKTVRVEGVTATAAVQLLGGPGAGGGEQDSER